MNKFRLAGYDIEINSPVYVALDISIQVDVAPNYYGSEIKKTLLKVFGNSVLPSGEYGFFNPDDWTFGQSVFLSQIYKVALDVQGVTSVTLQHFRRWAMRANDEIRKGVIEMAPNEIPRLDNDPDYPENGMIEFIIVGGL